MASTRSCSSYRGRIAPRWNHTETPPRPSAALLARWLGGSKLNQLGLLYGQAGVLLRVYQTSNISNEHFDTVVATVRGDPERAWPFDAYPT